MKNPKSVRESLSKEKLRQAEEMILSAKDYRLKRLMRLMLSISYDDLFFLEQVLCCMIDDEE